MDAISAAASDPAIAQVDKGFSTLDSDEFTRLILTELGNQDPLEPNDTNALLEQLSTIRSIESDNQLNETLGQLVDRSDFTAAAGLIGTRVTTADDGAIPREVLGVAQTRDGVSVTIEGGRSVPLSSITTVLGAESAS